ncbi:MAG TPA: peptidase inhibitor family I36 protein [Flexivirga sp.]|uniref:peptidase inhibitor family I36 protein n=1 Tax=Flexivirga sp. TaxID=1962927 RepID=UPI002C2023A9|nr:peptidase inhibitor family I36 protein [Flexivirga sp.]HWC22225.1 peptidase inhibitor family I36 protein [Flexivirga sp.]
MTFRRKAMVALAGSTIALGGTVTVAVPAHAATARNGVCESGEFCLYYNSDQGGSVSDFTTSVSNYGTDPATCYVFKGTGAGKGLCVKNNAASVWNRTSKTVYVYYNSGYAGTKQSFATGVKGNLNSTLKNNDASHHIGAISGTVTGATVISRAKVWVDAGVPYSQTHYYQGYREDCSGYVSMAWGLAKPGTTTSAMPNYGKYITKSALRTGDVLLNSNVGSQGHVVIFQKWANTAHTSYWAYEESGSHGAVHRINPYPYYSGYGTFKPFHYSKLVS